MEVDDVVVVVAVVEVDTVVVVDADVGGWG